MSCSDSVAQVRAVLCQVVTQEGKSLAGNGGEEPTRRWVKLALLCIIQAHYLADIKSISVFAAPCTTDLLHSRPKRQT